MQTLAAREYVLRSHALGLQQRYLHRWLLGNTTPDPVTRRPPAQNAALLPLLRCVAFHAFDRSNRCRRWGECLKQRRCGVVR